MAYVKVQRPCQECGEEYDATANAVLAKFLGSQARGIPYLCPPCREKAMAAMSLETHDTYERGLADDRARLVGREVPGAYIGKGLVDFDPTGNEDRVQYIRSWLEGFPPGRPQGYPSLYICSRNYGVGKTHLACAIIQTLIGRLDRRRAASPYRFYEAVRLKGRLREAQAFSAAEKVADVLAELMAAWLVVLDDVGKERMTGAEVDFVAEMYYNLINGRYNASLPVVITSNLAFDRPWREGGLTLADLVGGAVVSRLREMCRGKIIDLEGQDRR